MLAELRPAHAEQAAGALRAPQRPYDPHKGPTIPTKALRSPQRPYDPHKGPTIPTKALRSPHKPYDPHKGPTSPTKALKSPTEALRTLSENFVMEPQTDRPCL